MADKLVKFYEEAEKMGGMKAKMRLALLTSVPFGNAKTLPDSPDNFQKFEKGILEISKEFKLQGKV